DVLSSFRIEPGQCLKTAAKSSDSCEKVVKLPLAVLQTGDEPSRHKTPETDSTTLADQGRCCITVGNAPLGTVRPSLASAQPSFSALEHNSGSGEDNFFLDHICRKSAFRVTAGHHTLSALSRRFSTGRTCAVDSRSQFSQLFNNLTETFVCVWSRFGAERNGTDYSNQGD